MALNPERLAGQRIRPPSALARHYALIEAARNGTAAYDVVHCQTTLQVLEALLLTGRMPNPWSS